MQQHLTTIRKTWPMAAVGCLLLGIALTAQSFNKPGGNAFAKSTPIPMSPEEEAAISSANSLSNAFRYATNRVMPAVVTIETRPVKTTEVAKPNPTDESPFGDMERFKGTPFEDFFKDPRFQFKGVPSPQQPRQRAGIGSGVIIDPSGVVLTNAHVVRGGGDVTVRLQDGREYKAMDVKTDVKTDIAVVRIEAEDLVAARLGNSDHVEIGDWVLALGQPFGLESTVTSGIISAKHRGIGITDRENFLQTDAAINPGNSGGPLVNLRGEVIGINTAISSRGGGNEGIGFAVPANLAKWVSDQLVDSGTVRRAFLGVGIQAVNHQLAEQLDVQPRAGVLITEVRSGTPAEAAGLKTGDLIVSLNGNDVTSPRTLQMLVERTKLGEAQNLVVMRDGKRMELQFTPVAQSDAGSIGSGLAKRGAAAASTPLSKLGLQLDELSADVAKQLGVKNVQGVVITQVDADSSAARAGLESGMIITQVNRQAVSSIADVTKVMADHDMESGVLLLVRSADGSRFVVLQP